MQRIIATKAKEKLTEADYNKLLPLLNNMVRHHKKLRWYLKMENFDGWELKLFGKM